MLFNLFKVEFGKKRKNGGPVGGFGKKRKAGSCVEFGAAVTK